MAEKLIQRLTIAIATASNDDMSEPGTEKRTRHTDRVNVMIDARDALSASPAPTLPTREGIARTIYESRNGRGCTPWSARPRAHQEPYLKDADAILSLFTPPKPAAPVQTPTVEVIEIRKGRVEPPPSP